MLVLTRKAGEKIVIGEKVTVVINRISGNRVTIGVEAPSDVKILRGELERFVDEFEEAEPESETTRATVIAPAAFDFDDGTSVPTPPRLAR